MVSRILPIHCRTRFDDESPVGIAAMAREDGFAGPAELVIGTELPGVFVWAMDGLRRAMARGKIETSQSTQEEKKSIWRDSNLVARFIEDCTEYSPWHRIPVNDFCLAVSVWFGQNKGESRGYMPSNDAISRAVTALHDECIERERDQSARYLIGIKLNDEGEKYFSTGKTSLAYDTKRVDVSSNDASQLIPSSWDIKERVIKMRKAQASLNASAGKNTDGTNG